MGLDHVRQDNDSITGDFRDRWRHVESPYPTLRCPCTGTPRKRTLRAISTDIRQI